MIKKMIRELRSADSAKRRILAFELADHAGQGDKAAFEELLHMAGGGSFGFYKNYRAEDQLIGIEALGKTRLPQALACLKSWLEYREVYTESCTGLACGSDHHPEWSAIAYDFFNAPEKLREKLKYTGPRFSLSESAPAPMSVEDHRASRGENLYHLTIIKAIDRLEAVHQ